MSRSKKAPNNIMEQSRVNLDKMLAQLSGPQSPQDDPVTEPSGPISHDSPPSHLDTNFELPGEPSLVAGYAPTDIPPTTHIVDSSPTPNLNTPDTVATWPTLPAQSGIADNPVDDDTLAIFEDHYEEIDVDLIHLSGINVRDQIETEPEFDELIASIQTHGLLEPIVVVPSDPPGHFKLLAGERRYRAIRALHWTRVMAHVKVPSSDIDYETVMLVENVQRKNFEAIEEAEGYRRLKQRGLSHHEIAQQVKKPRSYIIAMLRLTTSPALKKRVLSQELTTSQAMEIARLIRDGAELVPGSIDWTCEWVWKTHPSVLELRLMIKQVIETAALPSASALRSRPSSFVEKELLRMEKIQKQLDKQSPASLQLLADSYARFEEQIRNKLATLARDDNDN